MRVVVAAVLALTCQLAHADGPLAPEPYPTVTPPGLTPAVTAPPPAPVVASYRHQTLIADGIAAGLLVVALSSEDNRQAESIAKVSVATYLLGAPLTHVMKGRNGHALTSVAMRVGFPIIGGMLANGMTKRECYDYCESNDDEIVLGVFAGAIAASAIDAIYLAKGDAPKQEPSWTPTARASQNGFALGVRGSF
jgi:hypothetical protein